MGGLNPPTSLSQACIPPPKRGAWFLDFGLGTIPKGANPKGNPLGGVSRAILPQMAPLILGLLGFAGEYSWSNRYRFLSIYSDFLGRTFLVISRVVFTVDY